MPRTLARSPLYPNAPSVIKGGLVFPGVNGQPRTIYNTDWTNIQPRIGVAWQIHAEDGDARRIRHLSPP